MRKHLLERDDGKQVSGLEAIPDHLALAYNAWAPVSETDGKVPDQQRQGWLAKLAAIAVDGDYRHAFERWKSSFDRPGDRTFEVTLASRLLIGHGNSSATDVGLTVHHTWGVPVIPGTALKGLLAHYVEASYGPEPDNDDELRERFRGVTWRGSRILRGPGEFSRVLFGAPDSDEDDGGAAAGRVTFHDALYVPNSGPPFAVDVLTVHQKQYYDAHMGGGPASDRWPTDYDSPNPVSFLTVRPGVRFLIALSGPPDWTKLARQLLLDALARWGVGAKTSAGYGRRAVETDHGARSQLAPAPQSIPKAGDTVEAILLEEKTKKGGWRARHEPSDRSGPITNSEKVPSTMKPGDRITLKVRSVSKSEISFDLPSERDTASRQGGKSTNRRGKP